MSDERMTVAELLTEIDRGWQAFTAYLGTLTAEQLTVPKDAAGWSAQDHVIHLADWERSLIPFLNKENRWPTMGVDEATWKEASWDKINGILQQRGKDKTVEEARAYADAAHRQLVDKIKTLTDEDLYRPYHYYQTSYYQTGSQYDTPAINLLKDDTYHHYEEHTPWIAAIVTKGQTMSKTELLEKIDQGWNDYQGYLMSLTPGQMTIPTDAAGWRALDHVIHLADWEKGVLGMLNMQDRAGAMGVDSAIWDKQEFDEINAILQKRSKNKTLDQARAYVMDVHQRLVDKVKSMTDEELQRPYKYYQPKSDREAPVVNWVQMNTFNHYAEHRPWIAAIVEDKAQITKAALLSKIQASWDALNQFVNGLSDEQKSGFKDAAGWTVKDHIIHMAIWEDGLTALLAKQDRRAHMDIDEATWKSGDDPINAVIQQRYKDLTWDAVQQKRQAIHDKLLSQINAMSEETLHQAYDEYNPVSSSKYPVYEYILSTTYEHYGDHRPWMEAIAAGGAR
jgi:hypothetical protein